jgi:quercetin dioxygenase-like cupin family protein
MTTSAGRAQHAERPQVFDLEALVQVAEGGIVSKTLVETGCLKLVHFTFAQGQELSEHTASVPATIHVLGGHGTVRLGVEEHEAQPGRLFYLPAGQRHAVHADDELVLLLTLFRV